MWQVVPALDGWDANNDIVRGRSGYGGGGDRPVGKNPGWA
jgi:hypothetical protein